MSERECRPPEGAEDRTWHWIRSPRGNMTPARWFGPADWGNIASMCGGYSASWLSSQGWRYVAPCITPEGGEHG